MVVVKYPNVRFKRPPETSCFCSRFLLFAKCQGFFNMACIHVFNLTNISFKASNSKLEFLSRRLLCIFSQFPQIDGNSDSIITHVCELNFT